MVLEVSARLFAGILASGNPLTATEAVQSRWAAIETARRMVDEVTGRDPEPPPLDLSQMDVPQLEMVGYVSRHQGVVFETFEREAITAALQMTQNNITRAAQILGFKRTTMQMRVQRLRSAEASG